jgi:hypothetical protein
MKKTIRLLSLFIILGFVVTMLIPEVDAGQRNLRTNKVLNKHHLTSKTPVVFDDPASTARPHWDATSIDKIIAYFSNIKNQLDENTNGDGATPNCPECDGYGPYNVCLEGIPNGDGCVYAPCDCGGSSDDMGSSIDLTNDWLRVFVIDNEGNLAELGKNALNNLQLLNQLANSLPAGTTPAQR